MKKINEEALCEILINTTDELALREFFEARTSEWRHWDDSGQQKTGALSDMVRRLPERHASDYIPYALKILLEQENDELFVTSLALLRNLVLRSHSSEMSFDLQVAMDQIDKKVIGLGDQDANKIWIDIVTKYLGVGM